MGSMAFFEKLVEKKLMNLHCGYIGKVIWTDGKTATVQPLGLVNAASGNGTKARAVVSNVPVACRYKIGTKTITYATNADGATASQIVAVPEQIASGDIVACLCADWDITEARRGNNELPPASSHNISDSIIVGIL